jgi:hypothetical protein
MASIQLTTESVSRAEQFLLQYLRDSGYSGSLEDGTGIYDVLIKAYSLLYAMFQEQADKVSGYLSLDKAAELQETLGDEYDDAIDVILSNWFVTRKEGTPTTGILRLWFTRPLDYLSITAGDQLFSYSNTFFTPVRSTVFTEDDFQMIRNTPQSEDEYYVEVEVESTENAEIDVTASTAFTTYLNNVYFIRATAKSDFETGKEKESNTEFIERTQTAITTRELITPSAIQTVIPQEYPTVTGVYVAGHGDDEQIRDIITSGDLQVHVGNKADIYVNSPFTKATVATTVPDNLLIELEDVLSDYPCVAHVFNVYESGTDTEVPYTMSVTEATWLTTGHGAVIEIDDSVEVDTAIDIVFLYSAVVPSVDLLMASDDNRVVCYDPYIKAMHPVVLSFEIHLLPGGLSNFSTVETAIKTSVVSYINSLSNTDVYSESKLLAYIHNSNSILNGITVPITATYTLFNEKEGTLFTNSCPPYFEIPAGSNLSNQISLNTVKLYTDSDLITISN